MVMKMPAKSLATSRIGPQENSLASRRALGVTFREMSPRMTMDASRRRFW
jgi:hypothetical protein